ncbi:MAG: DUF4097 domain-containing protein [Lachnospiraceae bacterium]|nr:DUF4097 domain-containing protein [Lachnospiraceae bacterium]
MNKFKVTAVIAGIAALLIGIVLMISGLKFGASPFVSIGKNASVTDREIIDGTVDIEEFDELILGVSSIDVKVVKGNGYSLEYHAREDNIPEVKQKGKKLEIVQKPSSWVLLDFRSIGYSGEQYYVLTIPDNDKMYKGELKCSSGSISLDGFNMNGSVLASSGEINIANSICDKLNLTLSSGDIRLENGEFGTLELALSSGDVVSDGCRTQNLKVGLTSGTVTFNDLTADNVECGLTSGDLMIQLNGAPSDYDVNLKATSGEIVFDGKEIDGSYTERASSGKKIDVHCTSGDIDISFK